MCQDIHFVRLYLYLATSTVRGGPVSCTPHQHNNALALPDRLSLLLICGSLFRIVLIVMVVFLQAELVVNPVTSLSFQEY
jgi:hypothetical protein